MKKTKKRKIDRSVSRAFSRAREDYSVVANSKVTSWKAYSSITFVAGFAAALIWGYYASIYPVTKADEVGGVTLTASANVESHKVQEEFPVDIILDTDGSNVVAVQAIFSFDKNRMEFLDSSVAGSEFNLTVKNTVDQATGQGHIVLAKPTPGVSGKNLKIATLRFRTLSDFPEPSIALKNEPGNINASSAALLDDGKGTNILRSVTNWWPQSTPPSPPPSPQAADPTGSPGNLVAPLSDNIVRMSWNSEAGADGSYVIERRLASGEFQQIAALGIAQNIFADRSAQASKSYVYRVCRMSVSGEKNCVMEQQVKTMKKKNIVKPNLSAASANGQVSLSWSPVYTSDFTVIIQRRLGGKKKFTTLSVLNSDNQNSFSDTNVVPGTKYEYKLVVRASKKKQQESRKVRVLAQ